MSSEICIAILAHKRYMKLERLLNQIASLSNFFIYCYIDFDVCKSEQWIKTASIANTFFQKIPDRSLYISASNQLGPNLSFLSLISMIDRSKYSTVVFLEEDMILSDYTFFDAVQWFHESKSKLAHYNIWSFGSRSYSCLFKGAYISQDYRIWASAFDLPTFDRYYLPVNHMRSIYKTLLLRDLNPAIIASFFYIQLLTAHSHCSDYYDYQMSLLNIVHNLYQLVSPIQIAEHDAYHEDSYNYNTKTLKTNPRNHPPRLSLYTHYDVTSLLDSLDIKSLPVSSFIDNFNVNIFLELLVSLLKTFIRKLILLILLIAYRVYPSSIKSLILRLT